MGAIQVSSIKGGSQGETHASSNESCGHVLISAGLQDNPHLLHEVVR
jgi:hypothetical protein